MNGQRRQRPAVWRRLRAGVALAALSALAAPDSQAFETDQYLALDAEISDSAEAVNAFLNQELDRFLVSAEAGRLGCSELPPRYYRHLFQGLLASRLQNFLKSDPAVDLFPDGVGYREHLRLSVYRRPSFPYVLPLSPTIRIGEVRFGLDKFGHLFGFGRRYYKHYLRRLARGDSQEAAIRVVVRRGLRQERFFVGGWADGVFSYGDLEANYQGMELARDFCEGENPLVERAVDAWRRRRDVDLREYVTPSFDESFNNNHYPGPRWKKVRPILEAEYCDRYFSPVVQARLRRYRMIDRPNLSKRTIEEYFERKGRNPQKSHSMEQICRPDTSLSAVSSSY